MYYSQTFKGLWLLDFSSISRGFQAKARTSLGEGRQRRGWSCTHWLLEDMHPAAPAPPKLASQAGQPGLSSPFQSTRPGSWRAVEWHENGSFPLSLKALLLNPLCLLGPTSPWEATASHMWLNRRLTERQNSTQKTCIQCCDMPGTALVQGIQHQQKWLKNNFLGSCGLSGNQYDPLSSGKRKSKRDWASTVALMMCQEFYISFHYLLQDEIITTTLEMIKSRPKEVS